MNAFQAQYPLSSRKFWKKMFGTIPGTLIFALFVGFLGSFIPFIMATSNGNAASDPVALVIHFVEILAVVVAIISAWNIWYYKTYIRLYFYEGGDNFITIKKGVFMPKEIHIQYQKIQDVYVDQDLIDRVMGLYDVHIASATAASGMEAHIDGVDAQTAEGLKNFFLQKIQGVSNQPPAPQMGVGATTVTPASALQAFTGNISSQVYPIQGRWIVTQAINAVITSIFMGLIVEVFIWAKLEEGFNLGVLLGIIVVWFLFQFIGQLIWMKNYSFAFLPEYVQFNTGILSRSERHLPYKSIQDVTVAQSLMDRILGLSNVVIENASQIQMAKGQSVNATIKIVGLNPADAQAITESLKTVLMSKDSSKMGL